MKRESTLPIRAGRSYPDNLSGYLFAAPWLIGFLGLTLLPMIASVILSFTVGLSFFFVTIGFRHGTENGVRTIQKEVSFVRALREIPSGMAHR